MAMMSPIYNKSDPCKSIAFHPLPLSCSSCLPIPASSFHCFCLTHFPHHTSRFSCKPYIISASLAVSFSVSLPIHLSVFCIVSVSSWKSSSALSCLHFTFCLSPLFSSSSSHCLSLSHCASLSVCPYVSVPLSLSQSLSLSPVSISASVSVSLSLCIRILPTFCPCSLFLSLYLSPSVLYLLPSLYLSTFYDLAFHVLT